MATQPIQYPPIQIFETGVALPGPNSKNIVQFPLNPLFPRNLLYAYCFNGVDASGAGHVALDYRFSANQQMLFSLPFVYNNTTDGINRYGGATPLPVDPLWPSGPTSLFGWSMVGAQSSSSENQLIFTPLSLLAGESNRTNLSPFELVLNADKLIIQPITQSISATTFRFWTAIIQLPIEN